MNKLCFKYCSFWLSKVIFKLSKDEVKSKYRDIEKLSIKISEIRSHLSFNECCEINGLLPNYTNIYIYIYIYSSLNSMII